MSQDLIKGIDLTGRTSVAGDELNQLVDEANPSSDRGFILTTTDVLGVAVVPDPTDTGEDKLERYIWRRVTADTVVLYSWNPSAATNVTYLKWQSATQLAVAPNSLTTSMYQNASVTNDKIASVAASKVTGLASAFPPSGAASGDLTGTYPAPTVAANAITSTKLSSSNSDDNLRAVGNDHVKTQSVVAIGLAGKLSIAGFAAYQTMALNAAGTAFEAITNYFTRLATLGTAFQIPRVNSGATALEWVDSPNIQRLIKAIAATTGTGAFTPSTATPVYNSSGDHLTSLTITPKLTTSLIRVKFTAWVSNSAAGRVTASLFNSTGATDIAVNAAVTTISAVAEGQQIELEYVYAPASVSAITFTINIGTSTGTYGINKGTSTTTLNGVGLSYLTVEEINGTLS